MSGVADYWTFRVNLDDRELVDAFDELPLWSAMFGRLLLDNVRLAPNINLLDVGCGTGFPLLELAQRLGPGSRACGVDTWRLALKRARAKARTFGVSNVEITETDATAMPFADGEFDLIVSNLGVNNFTDPSGALRECRRVIKPGGALALTSNLKGHLREFYEAYEKTLVETGLERCIDALDAQEATRLTRAGLVELCEGAGFRVTRLVDETFAMRFADGTAFLRHYFVKLAFLEGWREVVAAEDGPALFAALERRLNERARAEGELRMTVPALFVEAERADRP